MSGTFELKWKLSNSSTSRFVQVPFPTTRIELIELKLMSVEFEFAILNLPHVWRFFSIALMMHSDFIFVNIYVQGDNFKIVI